MRLLPFEYAVRNLGRSPLRLAASVGGSALVVLLVIAAGGFVRGMQKSLTFASDGGNVMLLGAGSEESVERSEIRPAAAALLGGSVSGLARSAGVEHVSPEVHVALVMRTAQDDPREYQAVLRGVTPAAFLVHTRVRVIEGHPPRPGEYEVMVGRLAATRLGLPDAALAVGNSLWFDNRPWRISGRFAAPQSVMDAEIWIPLTDLRVATRRETISCVVATLGDATFEDVDIWSKQRLDLELVAVREADYYASLLTFYRPVRVMVWTTAVLIALGGLFGGLNTMYAAFAARVRELGALQTLGYSRGAIIVSFLQESLLASLAGAIVATAIGLWLLDGVAVRFSMGAFALAVDAPVVLRGFAAAVLLAVVGIAPPLWRCLRMPIVEALRAG